MRPRIRVLCLGALVYGAALPAEIARAQAARPNIIHLFADDLGWGSVGFNGQTQIATPHLDALAAGGMILDNAYATPVCAPSRGTLLTGFHQGHSSVDGNNRVATGFRAEDVMTPEVLAPAGYTSAIFGKWGFGANGVRNLNGPDPLPSIILPDSLPTSHGFEHFYGYLNHGAAHDYFYDWMWQSDPMAPHGVATVTNNGGPNGTPEYTHDLIAARSEQFIADQAADGSPFYMQVSYAIPHWDIDSIVDAPGGYGIYANMPWTDKQKAYAAMITRMDASIGALMARLDDPNGDGDNSDSMLANTLVLFTSDNGPTTEDDSPIDFFNAAGPFRGGKFESYEGGIRMPTVAYWPGTILPGSTSDYPTDLADFMATAADLAGVEAPVGIDGTSIVPTLTGEGRQRARDHLVFEHQGGKGTDPDPRTGRWAVIRRDGMKLIRYQDDSFDLFDLHADPGETTPLDLGVPANAQIVEALRAVAFEEGLLRGVVEYRTWTGLSGGDVHDAANWDGIGRPHGYWSAVIANTGDVPRIAFVSRDVATLGVEVRGESARQVVDVHAARSLVGRNEVRIGDNGRVDLSGGTLATSRWVNVRAGGELRGEGTVIGDVYNEGLLSPGRPPEPTAWPIAPPTALPPITLDTGVVTATTFDFTGVQDDVPLLNTTSQSAYIEVSRGLDFGPGIHPRLGGGNTDAGDEFNLAGHTASTLQQAIDAGDYVAFTVEPVDGAGLVPSVVSFGLWRNGGAAGRHWAILSSIDGFTSDAALVQATYTDSGIGNQHLLSASLSAVEAVAGPIEFRLYGWGATAATGNTHINAVSLDGRFVAVSTLEFDFAGVQDTAPLTALRRHHSSLALAVGLDFGPGVAPRHPGGGESDAGDEFHVAGFSTGDTLQSALDGESYLSFAVKPVAGMAMLPDSVSFTLWRGDTGSATDYAVLSSVGGFAPGQQLAQAQHAATGPDNRFTLTGSFIDAQPTTDEVEFRLYGWNAATLLDSSHLVGASMRAAFASVVDSTIQPAGSLVVHGDLYHLQGGLISIDLAGYSPGVDYDTIDVLGQIELEGNLMVSLRDSGSGPFAPAAGDSFTILTAADGVSGQFSEVLLPPLAMGFDWHVEYLSDMVNLLVVATADYNGDGVVDAADYVLWRNNGGTPQQYDLWRADFGATSGGAAIDLNPASSAAVPEPPTAALVLLAVAIAIRRQPRSLRTNQ